MTQEVQQPVTDDIIDQIYAEINNKPLPKHVSKHKHSFLILFGINIYFLLVFFYYNSLNYYFEIQHGFADALTTTSPYALPMLLAFIGFLVWSGFLTGFYIHKKFFGVKK